MFNFFKKNKTPPTGSPSTRHDEPDFTKYPELRRHHRMIMSRIKTRPAYAWGVLCGCDLAKTLGHNKTSVIEFGVGGGNGLVALERIAEEVEKILELHIDVYGFDTGAGLPDIRDYRDLPQQWKKGNFAMDIPRLKNELNRAELVIGLVSKTVPEFIRKDLTPVSFVAFDMDLYSSTLAAMQLFDAEQSKLLPRIYCYFDEIFAFSFCDFNGERLAIHDFNQAHEHTKIAKIHGLQYYCGDRHAMWPEQMYLAHLFNHEKYAEYDGMLQFDQLPLGAGRYRSDKFEL